MRTGRLPAQRLGIGNLVNKSLTANRRIAYWGVDTSNSADAADLTIADTTTYMSTVDAAFVMGYTLDNATGSIGQMVINAITYGTVNFICDDSTLKHKIKVSYLIIGTPDATYIVDQAQQSCNDPLYTIEGIGADSMTKQYLWNGTQPIMQKFLRQNDLFMLAFQQGFIFGRVLFAERMQFKPYKVINSAGTAVEVAAGSSQAELRFRDPRNTNVDLLYMDDETDVNAFNLPWILHGSIGIRPRTNALRMTLTYPEAKSKFGKFPDADPIQGTSAGNFLGYLSGENSPYEIPSDFLELWIPPKIHIGHQWYNDDAINHGPSLHLLFTLYHFQILRPDGPPDESDLIKKMATRKVPAAVAQCGPSQSLLQYTYGSSWGVQPIALYEATTLGGGY